MPDLRLVMMGTGTFAEPTFEAILAGPHPVVGLMTQPDRPTGAARGSTRQTGRGMATIADEAGVPVLRPERINTPEGVAALQAWAPDLLVVAAYGQILSADVMAVARLGGINVHASLLPRYRGAAPVAWAIRRGETTTGVTIIRMTTGLDAGAMLAQASLAIEPDETAGELESRLAPLGARLACNVIDRFAAGEQVEGRQQDPALVTKAPKLTKEHGLIDWSQPAQEVCRQVRAMQPWPTAYTFLHHAGKPPQRLVIGRTQIGSPLDGPPGRIAVEAGRMLVASGGAQAVEVLELQPAGKKRMSAGDFLRGHRPGPDDRLGPEVA